MRSSKNNTKITEKQLLLQYGGKLVHNQSLDTFSLLSLIYILNQSMQGNWTGHPFSAISVTFYRTQVYLGSDLWVQVSQTNSMMFCWLKDILWEKVILCEKLSHEKKLSCEKKLSQEKKVILWGKLSCEKVVFWEKDASWKSEKE